MKNRYRSLAVVLLLSVFAVSCDKDNNTSSKSSGSDEEQTYNVVSSKTFANYDTFLTQMGSGSNSIYATAMSLSGVKEVVDAKFTVKDSPVKAIRYVYETVDPQGQSITESAYLAYPESARNEDTPARGIIIYNHGTYLSDSQCPYNTDIFETVLAWMNYILVVPDYYGFGESSDRPQAYLNPDIAGRNAIDAYKNVLDILLDDGVYYSTKIYNVGYSQGGFNAIANERYVALASAGIKFTKTIAGAGSYDVPGTYEAFLSGDYSNGSIFAVAAAISFNEVEGLGLPYSAMFKEPLLSNYSEWFLSKRYTSSEITSKMGTTNIKDLLTPEMTSKTGNAFNSIWNVCREFSLTNGDWKPQSGSNILLYHAGNDDVVPYSNMTALKNTMNVTGASYTITCKDLEDVTLPSDLQTALTFVGGSMSKHLVGAVYFIYDIIANVL